MFQFESLNGQCIPSVPLSVRPSFYGDTPSLTGALRCTHAGVSISGSYILEYQLDETDFLRVLLNHNASVMQLLLFTRNPQDLAFIPGNRPTSLVADSIAHLYRYQLRCERYTLPLTSAQCAKYKLVKDTIQQLEQLLPAERALNPRDWQNQESLRSNVINILEQSRRANRLITSQFLVSEGMCELFAYEASTAAQNYQFNRHHSVSLHDQMLFTNEEDKQAYFIWDSELHIGQDEEKLKEVIQYLSQLYKLYPACDLSNFDANRLKRFGSFLQKQVFEWHQWIRSFASPSPEQTTLKQRTRINGLATLSISPYYQLQGLRQKGYSSIDEMVNVLFPQKQQQSIPRLHCLREAVLLLNRSAEGSTAHVPDHKTFFIRLNNLVHGIRYFVKDNLIYPLPHGNDLYTLNQLAKSHLHPLTRLKLIIRIFIARSPQLVRTFFHSIRYFFTRLLREFIGKIHAQHSVSNIDDAASTLSSDSKPLALSINKTPALTTDWLISFFETFFAQKQYIIMQYDHKKSPPFYANPFHKGLSTSRMITRFFVEESERNPIFGLLGMLAYGYGISAILIPQKLTHALHQLHLGILDKGIHPTQTLAQWLSHGKTAEAFSAASSLWQSIVLSGDLDGYMVKFISILKEQPIELTLASALAMSVGYGACRLLPSIAEEIGSFPYISYIGIGAKGGAMTYDILSNAGDDWLIGTIKWALQQFFRLLHIIVGPVIEMAYYGKSGLLIGMRKSKDSAVRLLKEAIACLGDMLLILLTFLPIEGYTLIVHIPLRGVVQFLNKILTFFGHLEEIGQAMKDYSKMPNLISFLPPFSFLAFRALRISPDSKSRSLWRNTSAILTQLPLNLVRNIILIPTLNLASLISRLSIFILHGISQHLAFQTGAIIVLLAKAWDPSLGRVFSFLARTMMLINNALEGFLGRIKLYSLFKIQCLRNRIYHWGYDESETISQKTENDSKLNYFLDKPSRFETIPHTEEHCLFNTLLNVDPKPSTNKAARPSFFKPVAADLNVCSTGNTLYLP